MPPAPVAFRCGRPASARRRPAPAERRGERGEAHRPPHGETASRAVFTDRSQVEFRGLAERIASMPEDEVRELLALDDEEIVRRLDELAHA